MSHTIRPASVTLTAYNLGPDATEADFDAWASFVARWIDEAAGCYVVVDQHPFSNGPAADTIAAGCDEDEVAVREAVERLWEAWCGESSADAEVAS